MLGLFKWWYSAGWKGVLTSTARRISGLLTMFSTKTLVRTLFSPWRRVITTPGAGLDAKLRAYGDNLVSRCIGFTVRFFVLLAAGVSLALLALLGLAELVVWPLLPLASIGLIVKGLQ